MGIRDVRTRAGDQLFRRSHDNTHRSAENQSPVRIAGEPVAANAPHRPIAGSGLSLLSFPARHRHKRTKSMGHIAWRTFPKFGQIQFLHGLEPLTAARLRWMHMTCQGTTSPISWAKSAQPESP